MLPARTSRGQLTRHLVQPNPHGTISAMSETTDTAERELADAKRASALRKVVLEIERGAAGLGWDRPPMLYALVPTETLLDTDGLPEDMRETLIASKDENPFHLSAVLQDLDTSEDVEDVLPRIGWPEAVQGAALTVERLVVPPEVEEEAPEDPEEALEFISNHPSRTEVRLVIGVNREGDTWSAIRTRAFDDASNVVEGDNLVPALSAALKLGFDPDADVDTPIAEETLQVPNPASND